MKNNESRRIDLHTHSIHSDGTESIEKILLKAENLKLNTLSITDHNCVDGYDEIQNDEIRNIFKGTIIPGCEITTTYKGEIIEVLGYGFEYDKFRKKLAENMLSDRDKILRKYKVGCRTIDQLTENGVKFREKFGDMVFENPKQFYATSKETIMDAILREIKLYPENEKYFKDKDEFEKIDTKEFVRNKIYNPSSKLFIDQTDIYPSLNNVVKIVHDTGGLSFLAHLHVYSKNIANNLEEIVKKSKLDGLECYYTTFTKEQTKNLCEFCKKNNLYMSGRF